METTSASGAFLLTIIVVTSVTGGSLAGRFGH
jgi:hypothetical protein